MIRSRGHCNTMGTASTMACMAEALGMTIPGIAGTPAPDSRLLQHAHEAGRHAVEMVDADRRPSTVLSRGSFHNAIVALAAIGGSTNAVVHLLAIASRAGVELTLDDFDAIGSGVPLLVDLQPAGQHLMEDMFRAGGLLAVLREVEDLLDPTAVTVTGHPLVASLADARIVDEHGHQAAVSPAPGRGRDRRPAREPGPDRRRHQAISGVAAPPPASGSGGRLRQHRGLPCPHRRPGPRGRCRQRAGPPRMRAQGLPGDARGREPATAVQAPGPGRSGHGPDLRRPDERHGLRHGRPARVTGGGRRRAARRRRDR